jgi:hypothetical protein
MFAPKENAAVKRWLLPLVVLGGSLLLLWGCGEKEPEASAPAKDQAASSMPAAPPGTAPPLAGGGGPMTAPPLAGGTPQAGASGAPFAGGPAMSAEEALKSVSKMDAALVPLEKAMQSAEKAMKSQPDNAKAKADYVEATYKFGHAIMTDRSGNLPQVVMYRAALAAYRRALAVDPKHQPSRDDKKLIEDIYVQMGRSIPK